MYMCTCVFKKVKLSNSIVKHTLQTYFAFIHAYGGSDVIALYGN